MIFLQLRTSTPQLPFFWGFIGYCPRPNSQYLVMVCMCLERAQHSPRYVQIPTQHLSNLLALLILSTAKFTLFGHGLYAFGESPAFPKIRANIDATFAEFVGVLIFSTAKFTLFGLISSSSTPYSMQKLHTNKMSTYSLQFSAWVVTLVLSMSHELYSVWVGYSYAKLLWCSLL